MDRVRVDHQGHGTIVHQMHFHFGTETSGLHRNSPAPQRPDETLVQRFRQFGTRGGRPRGTSPFAAIPHQRELRDRQHRAFDLDNRSLHAVGLALEGKQTQLGDFPREAIGGFDRIEMPYSQENQ